MLGPPTEMISFTWFSYLISGCLKIEPFIKILILSAKLFIEMNWRDDKCFTQRMQDLELTSNIYEECQQQQLDIGVLEQEIYMLLLQTQQLHVRSH